MTIDLEAHYININAMLAFSPDKFEALAFIVAAVIKGGQKYSAGATGCELFD